MGGALCIFRALYKKILKPNKKLDKQFQGYVNYNEAENIKNTRWIDVNKICHNLKYRPETNHLVKKKAENHQKMKTSEVGVK